MSMMTAERARTISQPPILPDMPFWGPSRTESFRQLMGPFNPDRTSPNPTPRLQTEWNRVVNASAAYVVRGPISPFMIPATYGDPAGQAAALAIVDTDANTCADLALRWHLFADTAAAAKAVQIIVAWSSITSWDNSGGATTPLVWASRIPKLIQAAFLLAGYSGYTATVRNNFAAMLQRSVNGNASPSGQYTNNVGMWGLAFDIAAAKFLNNRPMLIKAIELWRKFFDYSIVGNVPIHEVYREGGEQGNGTTGLWYSNFTVYALTVAAEWARYSGEWLYDYTGADGSTFRGLAEKVRFWTRYPASFPYNTSGTQSETIRSLPHDEILHALWPSPESEWIINRFPNGTDRDSHGMRGAVLIYRGRPLYG